MSAYYNEWEPYAAEWLRNLIKEGLIADGEVDTRSIADVEPADLRGFTQCHFFAGIGGWSYALRLAGWADDRRVWTGSCPCQPFSTAGKQLANSDSRDLWPQWRRILEVEKPSVVFGEQVIGAVATGWYDRMHYDMEALNYAVTGADIPACGTGAPHVRSRAWFVADTLRRNKEVGWDVPGVGRQSKPTEEYGHWTVQSEPPVLGLADGLPGRMDILRAFGNAIVPQVAAEFIGAYMETVH